MQKPYLASLCLGFAMLPLTLQSNVAQAATTKIIPIGATASATYSGYPASNVYDGDSATSWNAGKLATQWIRLDLGRLMTINRIRLQIDQSPTGMTTHEVRVGAKPSSMTLARTYRASTSAGQWIDLDLSPGKPGDVRYVQVTTTTSPSWVAWKEIEVWGVPGDWRVQLVDTFDNADNANDSGLNDNSLDRQLHGPDWAGTNWMRRAGTWYDRLPSVWTSQVNHSSHPNVLSFHHDYVAVELMRRFWPGDPGTFRVSLTVDPSVNDTTSGNWVSVMLDRVSGKRGWVTESDFGFLISSNGSIQLFQNGTAKTISGTVPAAARYSIDLTITAGSPGTLVGTVNNSPISATLDGALPDGNTGAHLYVGTWTDPGQVSRVDNLTVFTLNPGPRHVDMYGYYWSEGFFGSHSAEVVSFTNFNFVESTAGLDAPACAGKKCFLQVRWEFFADGLGYLRPDWENFWQATLQVIKAKADRVAAVYIFDEPFWSVGNPQVPGVNPSFQTAYEMALDRVKRDLASMPILAVFAYPSLSSLPFVRNLDWVGFDRYPSATNFGLISSDLTALKSRIPGKPVFLVPQTYFGGNGSETASDAETAAINWQYYGLAVSDRSVKGLANFGLWCFASPATLPLTLSVQRILGTAITNN